MLVKNLEERLIELNKQSDILDAKFEEIEGQIEDLEEEKSYIENELDDIEDEIKNIKKQLLDIRIKEVSSFTGDKFKDDFIKASMFCEKENNIRESLMCVNISNNKLMACDGYKAIIIENSEIPEEFKNTIIKWYVRENFKDHINEIDDKLPNIEEIIKVAEDNYKYELKDILAKDFNSILKFKTYDSYPDLVISYKDIKMALKNEFIETALMVMGNEKFNIYFESPIKPLLLKNDKIKMIILPIRMYDYKGN